MRHLLRATVLAVALAASPAMAAAEQMGPAEPGTPGPHVTVTYRASYPANFLWLINSLAGDAHSSTSSFRTYWQRAGYGRPGDEADLAAFRRIRDRYEGDYLDPAEELHMPVPVSPASGDLRQKFFSLFFSSTRMDEVWAKAEILLDDGDRDALMRVFDHFRPRFDAFWKDAGYLETYRSRFEAYAKAHALSAELSRAARFLGVPADARLPVRVIFLFTPDAHHTYGRAVGPNLVVEVPANETPEGQVDVVVHELCHYFWERGGVEADATFATRFFGSGDRHAGPAWALLNEGIATAIGEGVAAERLAPTAFAKASAQPLGWYNDAHIDPFARALFPSVKSALAAGKPLRELAPDVLTAYAKALGAEDDDPRTYLASYILVDGYSRRQGFSRFFEQVPPRSVWHASFGSAARLLAEYPAQTAVVAATAADLERLSPEAFSLRPADLDALRRHDRALWVLRRPTNGYMFLVYGRDLAALDEAMARFGGLKRFSEGLSAL